MHEAVGRTQTLTDPLDPGRAAALHATLGLSGDPPAAGDPLPAFWHQIHFWDARPPLELGHDGHPATGGFIPDLGLPARMWAGGALDFHAPLILGRPAEKRSVIEAVEIKAGRSGRLGFVTLRHAFRQDGATCIAERQDLVYRAPPEDRPAPPPPPRAPGDETARETAEFSPTLLFRYSALTFNGHRIHYDLDFCRKVEGYPALVVHGPLLAQLLIGLAERRQGPLSRFAFRATAPLFDFERAELCWRDDGTLWVRGPDGRQCMTAEAG